MGRGRTLTIAMGIVLLIAAGAPATVAAQEDRVTITIAVITPNEEPVSGASITAYWDGGSTTGTTFSNGKALLDVPDGADLEVLVSHDDYVQNFPAQVEDASEREVDVTVYEKASLHVTVEDADGPVSNASVSFQKDGREVVNRATGSGGVVTSGTVEAGEYRVRVTKPGYYVQRESIDLSGETTETIQIERGTVTLEVNVTDDHFSPARPIGEATVEVAGSGSVTTQPTGIGRISVPVNTWTAIRVTKAEYRTVEQSVFVAEDDTTVDIDVRRQDAISLDLLSERVVVGESVSLAVTDEYGAPVSGATVRLDGEAVAETDDDGEAVLRVESAGEHGVVAEYESLRTDEQTVVGVADGGATPTATGTDTEVPGGMPGFGFPAIVAALVVIFGVLARRRR